MSWKLGSASDLEQIETPQFFASVMGFRLVEQIVTPFLSTYCSERGYQCRRVRPIN
jgi:hypothetical protein